MKKIILLFFIIFNVSLSTKIDGLDSIDLTNRIELTDITYNSYTNLPDTTIYFLAIYKDSNSNNIYFIEDPEIECFLMFQNDSLTVYKQDKKSFYKTLNTLDLIYHKFSQLLILLKDKNVVFYNDILFHKNDVMTSTEYDTLQNIINFTHTVNRGKEPVYNSSYILNLTTNEIEFNAIRQDFLNEEKFYQQFYRPSENDSAFSRYDEFFYKERFSYIPFIKEKPTKELPPKVEVGDTLDINYDFVGLNRPTTDIIGLFDNKEYLMLYNWGVWCGYCVMNTENVKKLYKENFPNIAFVTINCENDRATNEQVIKYLERKNIEYPVYVECDFIKNNGIYSYPSLIVIDRNFVVKAKFFGSVTEYKGYKLFLQENELIE